MIKKISKIIILILLIFSVEIKKCNAFAGISVPYVKTGSDGDESGGPSFEEGWDDPLNSNIKYYCQADYQIDVTYSTKIYGYNQENEEIIHETPNNSESILAGTAIGLKIEENTTISWDPPTITFKKIETYNTYPCNCTKRIRVCSDFQPLPVGAIGWFKLPFLVIQSPGSCHYETVSCQVGTEGCNCQTCGGGEDTTYPTSGEKYQECVKKVNDAIKEEAAGYEGSKYTVSLRNSNDIKQTNIVKQINGRGGCSGENPRTCIYTYSPKSVCINVKTSEVSYRDEDSCETGEMKIENENGHWHYFTPLNTKTNDDIALTMAYRSQSGLQGADFCKTAIEKNPTNYKNFVRDRYNQKLTGQTMAKDIETVSTGCYFGTEIKVITEQKFYNEMVDDDTKKLKGFNFYYKPIDINNPFPNDVSDNSLWKEWSESTNKTPDLTESYSSVTYTALNINANNIRNYNRNNLYTDWSNMYLDGTSKFIDDYGVQREGTINVYKLGCGPLNVNEYLLDESGNKLFDASGNPIKNKLYMKACGNS